MSDDLKNTGPQDDSRVNVNQPHEVQYWTRKFGCSEEELRSAVQSVGVSATAVGAWLAGKGR
jgi:hypothetical protein